MFQCLVLGLLPVHLSVPVQCQTGQDSQGSSNATRSPQLYPPLTRVFLESFKASIFHSFGCSQW